MNSEINNEEETKIRITASEIAEALSHPTRILILQLLRGKEAYVMDLVKWIGRPQANISQHLAILRDLGIVMDEREGMQVKYRIRDDKIFNVIDSLMDVAKSKMDRGEVMESPRLLRKMKKCMGRKMTWKGKKW